MAFRAILLSDVPLERLDCCAAGTGSEVAGAPEVLTVRAQRKFLPQHPRADALEVVHQGRHRDGGRVFDQQVDMVCLAVELQQLEAHLLGNAQADRLHPRQVLRLQNAAAVLDDEDQMDDKPRNTVPASPERDLTHYRPTVVGWLVCN